jgi:hypothetical protein
MKLFQGLVFDLISSSNLRIILRQPSLSVGCQALCLLVLLAVIYIPTDFYFFIDEIFSGNLECGKCCSKLYHIGKLAIGYVRHIFIQT